MNEFKIGDLEFKVKSMNAFELLAMKENLRYDSSKADDAIKAYKNMLEKIEVKIGENWFPCKEKGLEEYYPADLINNVSLLDKILHNFTFEYLVPLFQNSNVSKK